MNHVVGHQYCPVSPAASQHIWSEVMELEFILAWINFRLQICVSELKLRPSLLNILCFYIAYSSFWHSECQILPMISKGLLGDPFLLSSARNGDFLHGAELLNQSLGGAKSRLEPDKEGKKDQPTKQKNPQTFGFLLSLRWAGHALLIEHG